MNIAKAMPLALAILSACSQTATHGGGATGAAPMLDAFLAAYGQPAPYSTLDDSGDHITYSPQALENVAPGVVALIAKGEIPDGCRACSGNLSIYYLRHDATGFGRLGSWPDIGGKGDFGKALPWIIRRDIDNGPTLVTTNVQKDQSCSATLQELITLTPRQPVKIATVVVATTFAPAVAGQEGLHVAGQVVPVERGRSFAVELSGSDTVRQVYTRQGETFTTWQGGATGC